MLSNYLKTAIRNLWKNKTFSFINVAGLSYDGYVVKKSSEGGARLPHFIHYMWATVSHLFGFQRFSPLKPAVLNTCLQFLIRGASLNQSPFLYALSLIHP